jgi:hypothetical protein
MSLTAGQRLTLFKIDDLMAMTHRYELEVRTVGSGAFANAATIRLRGKRKEFYLDLKPDDILLDGWGQGFRTDGEAGGVFSGNACYNFVGDPDVIRAAIETKAVFPVSDGAKAKILVNRTARTTCDDSGTMLLYPDIETHHAVINRMKEARRPKIEPIEWQHLVPKAE